MATTMTRWNPMSEMMTLRDAMDRLLSESLVPPLGSIAQMVETHLPIDMYEENDQLVVKTSMPGVKPEDINIQVQDNVLTITGEVRAPQATQQGTQGNGGAQQTGGQSGQQGQGQQASKAQGQQAGQAQGQQTSQAQGNRQNWYVQERQYARFVRSVTLPFPVQVDKAEATLEDGVLTLKLPKAPQAKQQKIQVKTK
jgi:HSP20 family protein